MKPSITLNFDTVAQLKLFVEMLEAVERGNAPVVSPAPAGDPVPLRTVPSPAPQPVPAPSPMPPPAPSNNGSGAITIQQVMGAMQEYAKVHKAAGIKNVLSHIGIAKVTEANPEQLAWLKGVFDLNQPMAAAS